MMPVKTMMKKIIILSKENGKSLRRHTKNNWGRIILQKKGKRTWISRKSLGLIEDTK